MKYHYNIVIIGGGSAGLSAAQIAKTFKARVAIIEKSKMGGGCLNTGCVPSKAIIKTADIVSYQNKAKKYGLKNITIDYDFQDILKYTQKLIQEMAPHDSVERYKKMGVECFKGEALILDKHRVEVDEQILTTKNIIVATGAKPIIPDIKGLENIPYYTSDTIWSLKKTPKKMLILGAGPIGCEFSQTFSRLGISITLIEQGSHILHQEDKDVSKSIEVQLEKDDVTLLKNHLPDSFRINNSKPSLLCQTQNGTASISFDCILLTLGKKPNTQNIGLENAGVHLNDQQRLFTNQFLQTNIPNIFVCGDVAGRHQFTHIASHHAYYAVVNSLFRPFKKVKVKENVIPYTTFTHPQIAQVGLNEQSAQTKGIPYKVTLFKFKELDRAIIDGHLEGFIKVLTQPKKDKILGATIVGEHAGEIITEITFAMKHKLGLRKIINTLHSYPTFSEVNRLVAIKQQKRIIPSWVFKILKKWNTFSR